MRRLSPRDGRVLLVPREGDAAPSLAPEPAEPGADHMPQFPVVQMLTCAARPKRRGAWTATVALAQP